MWTPGVGEQQEEQMMKLSGKDIAQTEASRFTQTVTCRWCERTASLDIGPQHRTNDLGYHCNKCGKFSMVKVADKWFDQHQERNEELKEVWKSIPNDAYVTCRQSMRGTPFVYTVFLGGSKRPEEFMSRDIVEHILTDEYGMSYKQAHGTLMSAALTPGQKIFLQRHTRLVIAAEARESMKRTGGGSQLLTAGTQVLTAGTQVRINGQDAIFLRYSANDGFSIIALPAAPGQFGDAEVPTVELEVVDAGGPEVAEEFEFDKEEDEAALAGDLGEEEDVGGLEQALQHIEEAEAIVEDLVLDEAGEIGGEAVEEAKDFEEDLEDKEDHDEEHEESDDKDEESDDVSDDVSEDDGEKGKNPFAARRRAALPGRPTDPMVDDKLRHLQKLINDPAADPRVVQEAQRRYIELKRQIGAARTCPACEGTKKVDGESCWRCGGKGHVKKGFFNYKTTDDLKQSERPEHKTVAPKYTPHKSDMFPTEGKEYPKNVKDDTEANGEVKTADKTAQRRVHTHYAHSGDLKRAISVNRNELSIEDIRNICKFYANTGKIAYHEADELSRWFIGDKPRLLCARDVRAEEEKEDDDDEEVGCDECNHPSRSSCACDCHGGKGRGRGDREDFHADGRRKTASWRYDEWKRNKDRQQNPGQSACTCQGAYNQYCPEHGAKELNRGALSVRDLRRAEKEAGEVEVKDAHPESGVGAGNGGTDNPDPKRQAPPSANSITGPEKVKEHGAGDSPEEAGAVDSPDLGLPKGALSKKDLLVRAARHKDGCGCGFCSRMRDNQSSKTKSALSARDMKKVAHDGVGIFVPALHRGKEVLVIAVDNTSLRATVQDGSGNQRQVDFADLEPTKTGPYSGRTKKSDPGAKS